MVMQGELEVGSYIIWPSQVGMGDAGVYGPPRDTAKNRATLTHLRTQREVLWVSEGRRQAVERPSVFSLSPFSRTKIQALSVLLVSGSVCPQLSASLPRLLHLLLPLSVQTPSGG